MKKRIISLFVFTILLISVLTGCSDLEDLSQDYIQVNVVHELQSESYNNQKMYTYKVDAIVTNNYFMDLLDAKISLDIPDDVEVIEGKKEVKEKI